MVVMPVTMVMRDNDGDACKQCNVCKQGSDGKAGK